MNKFLIDRRRFLAGSAGVLGVAGLPFSAKAQASSITALMPGVLLPEDMRPAAEAAIQGRLENHPYVSATDTVARLLAPGAQGRYDLVNSMINFVGDPLIAADVLEPLDLSQIPNWDEVAPEWKERAVVKDGQVYMIPTMWAYDSFLFYKDLIPEDDEATQSWGVVFDDRWAGRVAIRDDAYQSIALTALYLGIEEPATMSSSDLDEVTKFLISKKQNFRTLWSTFGEAINLMVSKEIWGLMGGWMSMRLALQSQGLDVTNNWPREGLMYFYNGLCVPKGTTKAEMAYRAANYFLSEDYAAGLAAATDYGVTNAKTIASFSPEVVSRVGYDIVERGVKMYPYTWPEDMDAWIEAWNRFKVA